MNFVFRSIKKLESFQVFMAWCTGLCFMSFMTAPLALGLGFAGSLLLIKTKDYEFHSYSSIVLKISIVLMGFGMNWSEAISSSASGLALTGFSVLFTLFLGVFMGRLLKVDAKTALLITAGTAICGGSAAAAVAPVIQARNQQLSFALIVIFVLNALALVIFPWIGKLLHLNQEIFGHWAAIAIHDTSSVVGAAGVYGSKALQLATTVKLTRVLWIIPMVIILGIFNAQRDLKKVQVPWFILFFLMAMYISHLFPHFTLVYKKLDWLGRRGLLMALVLIGCSMNFSAMKEAGVKPFFLGIALWITVAATSLALLVNF